MTAPHEPTHLESGLVAVEIGRLVVPRFDQKGDHSAEIDALAVGSAYVVTADAPGTGRRVYEITLIDSAGAWGRVLWDTLRELTPGEVR